MSIPVPHSSPELKKTRQEGSRHRLSLGTKLPLIIIPLVLIAFVASAFLSIRTAQAALIDVLKNELTLQAESKAELIRANLIWNRSMAVDLAASAEVANYDEAAILKVIQNTLTRNEQIFGSTIAYEPYQFQSDLYYWSPYFSRTSNSELQFTQLGNPTYNYFDWDWYTLPKARRAPVLSPPYFDEGGGEIWMVTWSAPFFDENDTVKGVATADIAFSQTQEIVDQMTVGKNGYAFLLDNHGIILGIGENGGKYQAMVDSMLTAAQQPQTSGWSALISTMMAGNSGFTNAVDVRGQAMFVAYAPVGLDTGWSLGLAFPQAELFQKANPLQATLILYTSLLALVFGVILFLITRSITEPLHRLTQYTSSLTVEQLRLKEGKLPNTIQIRTRDELEDLAEAVNWMATEVARGFETLEEKVADRTRDLERRSLEAETIGKVARNITTVRDLDTLLNNAANVIQEQFKYSHVGIFLVDDLREYAFLRAATGEAGQQMLAQNHRLKIGESGIVGYVTQTGQPRIALDVNRDTAHLRNPLLPDTRSEMTLPLISGSRIIGALDVQSVMEAAFNGSDIQTMQTIADQLAVAIDNVRLIERTQESLNELNALYKDQARKTWRQVAQARPTAFEYDGLNIVAGRQKLPMDMLEQLSGGRSIILRDSLAHKKTKTGEEHTTLLVPLMLQGQLIGTVGIEKVGLSHEWTQDEVSMAENAATQASLALENARLLEETQRRAAKERTIGEISTRIGGLVDIDKILQATIQELSQTLPGAEVAIQFQPKDEG